MIKFALLTRLEGVLERLQVSFTNFMNILYIGLLFILQLFVFFEFGSLFFRVSHSKPDSVTMTMFTGFILHFVLFGIVALPAIFTQRSLSFLTYLWIGIVEVISILSWLLCFKQWCILLPQSFRNLRHHSWMMILLAVVVFLQMWIVFTHIDATADASYYIGKVTTDVYTNTMGCFDPYTGSKLTVLDSRRVIACFPEYNAVISQFFHIHPLKQAKLIMPEIIIIFANILYYHIGLLLFDGDKKRADGLVCFAFLINFFSNTIYTSSTFLLTRTYEGKSILANVVIPAMIYCFLLFWQEQNRMFSKYLLLIVCLSSCIFSSSSMLIVPVGVTAGMIPWILKERKWKYLKWYFLYILPNMIVAVLYFLASKGILRYYIK